LLETNATNFSPTSWPTKAQVESFLSAGCAIIETRLEAAGYSTPVGAAITISSLVANLETLYGAAQAESVQLSARISATERTRAHFFEERFNKGLDKLVGMDLSRAGLTHTTKTVITGTSISEKEAVDDDKDRVTPRFRRDQFRHAGTTRPAGVEADELIR
jgi:hypothetical protein